MEQEVKVAVLFDGAGLARLGLEQAGLDCVGVEIDPVKHHLSRMVGSGRCVLGDALTFDLSSYDAVWASPPCQRHSRSLQHQPTSELAGDFLDWSLALPHDVLWVENVRIRGKKPFGRLYNAAQFAPLQSRVRVVGGRYPEPEVTCRFRAVFPGICPTVMATEWKACKGPCKRLGTGRGCCNTRAARFYRRRMTIEECAYHQGFDIPAGWHEPPLSVSRWRRNLYEAVGNGVPVYMARAFGEAARRR
jgi:site-specific DNA-cytosine methylase